MIANVDLGTSIRLVFELRDHEVYDVRIIDLFARPVHNPPATLNLEGEASQRALVCDLRVVTLVRNPVRWVPPLVVSDVDDILYRIVHPQPLDRAGVRLSALAWVEQALDVLGYLSHRRSPFMPLSLFVCSQCRHGVEEVGVSLQPESEILFARGLLVFGISLAILALASYNILSKPFDRCV